MDQLTKEQYIETLISSPWQDIKDAAEFYGVEKSADDKWKDLIPAIADAKFADPEVVVEEHSEVEEPVVVEEVPAEEELFFDYVRQGVTLNCQHCGYEIRVDLVGNKICPVSHPKCPRSSPEVN